MLVVEDIAFAFAQLPLFSGVTFSAHPGTLLQLKGPNGVGKSTLMHILAGLLKPAAGRVRFVIRGEDVPDPRGVMVYLPSEGNGLFLRRDALGNLLYWGGLRGAP